MTDLDRAIAWYRDVLGLGHTTTARVPEGVEIAFVVDGAGAGVELFALEPQDVPEWDGPIAALRGGRAHVAFTVDDLDAAFARAVAAGGRPVWSRDPRRSPGSASRSSPTRTGPRRADVRRSLAGSGRCLARPGRG